MSRPGPRPSAAGSLRLEMLADLTLEVDGSPVRVTADGSEVLVSLADPAVVLDGLAGVPLPVGVRGRGVRRALAHGAEVATAQGFDVVVTGPAGVLVTVGRHAAPSRAVRLLTGSDRIALGRWSAVRGPVGRVARRRAVAVLVGLARRFRR